MSDQPTAPSAPEPHVPDIFADVHPSIPRGVSEDPPDAGHDYEDTGKEHQ